MTLDPAPLDAVIREMPRFTPFAKTLGLEIRDLAKGSASIALPPDARWTGDSEAALLHSGSLTALADQACGVAVMSSMKALEGLATLDLRMDYLRPARAEHEVVCRAHCHRLSRNVAFVRGELHQAGEREPVATVNAAFMRSTPQGPRPQTGSADGAGTTEAEGSGAQDAATAPAGARTLTVPPGRSPYVEFLGVSGAGGREGAPVFVLPYRPELIGNPLLPALHGGAVAGFAETAAVLHLLTGAAAPATAPPRGIDFSIDFLRSAGPSDVLASCTTVRLGRRVALVHITLWQDDARRPIASARAHLLLSGAR
jgi:uncharacterized protein (TIGR00369 family)